MGRNLQQRGLARKVREEGMAASRNARRILLLLLLPACTRKGVKSIGEHRARAAARTTQVHVMHRIKPTPGMMGLYVSPSGMTRPELSMARQLPI